MHAHARPQWAVSLVRGKSVGKKEDSQLLGEHVTGEPGGNPIHSHDELKGSVSWVPIYHFEGEVKLRLIEVYK